MERVVDNVIPMPVRRPFMIEHPEGAPAGLSIDPDILTGAAMCLADLRGERMQDVTPSRLDEYRRWMLLAAWLSDRDAAHVVAYHVEHQRGSALAGATMAAETPLQRLRCVELINNGLIAARDAVAGLRPAAHLVAVNLAEQDNDVRRTRVW